MSEGTGFRWRIPVFPPAWRSWVAWHWSQNTTRRGNGRVPEAPRAWQAHVTVKEQAQLYDATWKLLVRHGVVSDTSTYLLAMQIADAITAIRDQQRGDVCA